MSKIKFIKLSKLLDTYPNYIEKLKEGYLLLLTELTITNYIDTKVFIENIERISNMGAIIIAYIGEVNNDNFEIIASGTIIIEPKIIRSGKSVGHIEDIVVTKHMRGKGISQKILNLLKREANENNCYKVILNCDDNVKNVYIKNGFKEKGLEMGEYFEI
jgi:glucosamine-phosphate N-acetyltransferase